MKHMECEGAIREILERIDLVQGNQKCLTSNLTPIRIIVRPLQSRTNQIGLGFRLTGRLVVWVVAINPSLKIIQGTTTLISNQ